MPDEATVIDYDLISQLEAETERDYPLDVKKMLENIESARSAPLAISRRRSATDYAVHQYDRADQKR